MNTSEYDKSIGMPDMIKNGLSLRMKSLTLIRYSIKCRYRQ